MKLLLDTATFLHAVLEPEKLSTSARDLVANPEHERYLSTISCLEIIIKYHRKKLVLHQRPDRFIPEHRAKLATDVLPLDEESALHLSRLPYLHGDPFDRTLICQAIVHGMVLVTPDQNICRYPVRTAW